MSPNQTSQTGCGIGYPATCYAIPPATSRVPFQFVKGVIILLATVNGKAAALLLDTGATISLVDSHFAGEDGLRLDPLRLRTDGPDGEYVVREVQLSLGHLWLNRRIRVMDLTDTSKRVRVHLDGTVGTDLLQEFSAVRIDFKNLVIELEGAR